MKKKLLQNIDDAERAIVGYIFNSFNIVTERNKLSISSTLEKMKDIHSGFFCKECVKKYSTDSLFLNFIFLAICSDFYSDFNDIVSFKIC